ncbi:hypothetical protein ACFOZ1_07965 [Gracilibacillus marinus]|uniref:Uncharacterized protein n=1 Tax=Gracilibacillus marinus TaxID=630535 RepID=A0ABV8VTD9_9BACI
MCNDHVQELRRQLGEVQLAHQQATEILVEQLAEIKRIRAELIALQGGESEV